MANTGIYPAARILDTWVHHDWSRGIQLESLPAFSEIVVETRNTRYEITVIDGPAREVLIRGGKYFPEKCAARLSGSSLGGSFLKVGGIYAGFSMRFSRPVLRLSPPQFDSSVYTHDVPSTEVEIC